MIFYLIIKIIVFLILYI